MKIHSFSEVLALTQAAESHINQLIENDVLEVIVVDNNRFITDDSIREAFPYSELHT